MTTLWSAWAFIRSMIADPAKLIYLALYEETLVSMHLAVAATQFLIMFVSFVALVYYRSLHNLTSKSRRGGQLVEGQGPFAQYLATENAYWQTLGACNEFEHYLAMLLKTHQTFDEFMKRYLIIAGRVDPSVRTVASPWPSQRRL